MTPSVLNMVLAKAWEAFELEMKTRKERCIATGFGTFELRWCLDEAVKAAIAAMPPIKLVKAKYKTSEEIEAQQYSDYWHGVCDGIESAKASIEDAGLRWVE